MRAFSKNTRVAFLLSLLLGAHAGLAMAPADFDLANQNYDAGKFDEAKRLYESVRAAGQQNANLFYNLGNAEFRVGNPGGAAVNYERALALEPSHPEALANLHLVRSEAGAKIETRTWMDTLFPALSANAFSLLGAAALWIALASVTALAFGARRETRFWPGLLATCGFVVAAYSCAAVWRSEKNAALAIVVVPRADSRFAPADTSTLAETLPTASHVWILSERGAWTYCELPSRARAWVASKSIERVKPGA